MRGRYIDFISAYCDSWCERCDFTDRCSHFAVSVATTMCDGDFHAAIELAIGPPRVPGEQPHLTLEERASRLDGYEEPTAQELNEIGREMQERDTRVRRHPLSQASADYAVAAHRWLDANRGSANPALDAHAVAQWDLYLIHAKLGRALNGRDEDPKGRFWGSRVQNDWNGSAKVALLSVVRSERAWRAIADVSGDGGAAALADLLADLRQRITREFPRAMDFRRPGFDAESGVV